MDDSVEAICAKRSFFGPRAAIIAACLLSIVHQSCMRRPCLEYLPQSVLQWPMPLLGMPRLQSSATEFICGLRYSSRLLQKSLGDLPAGNFV